MASLLDKLKKRQQEANQRSGGKANWLTLEKNTPLTLHVLPNLENPDDEFYVERGTHYVNDESYTCPEVTFGREDSCPICSKIREFRSAISTNKKEMEDLKEGSEEYQAKADENAAYDAAIDDLYVSRRYLMNVFVPGDDTVKVYGAPKTVWNEILKNVIANLQSEETNVLDVNASYKFTITKKVDKDGTKYEVTMGIKASPLDKDPAKMEALLKTAPNLKSLLRETPLEDLQKALDDYVNGEGSSPAPKEEPAKEERREEPAPKAAPAQSAATSSLLSKIKRA